MPAKVQFNPSTLKVSYNNATGKVQMVQPCDTCPTSGTFTLTFSGINQCSGQPAFPSDPNTSFVCPYSCISTEGGYVFEVDSNGWHAKISCKNDSYEIVLYADISGSLYNAFAQIGIADPCKNSVNNFYSSGLCGSGVGTGVHYCGDYPGSATIFGYGGSCIAWLAA